MEFGPTIGDVIGNRWEVITHIGDVENIGHSATFHVRKLGTDVLARLMGVLPDLSSSEEIQRFKNAACITKELSSLGLQSIPPFIQFKEWENGYKFMYFCTAPVGPSLQRLRAQLPGHAHNRFSPFTSLRIALEMLFVIKDVHSAGYLSRRIGPEIFRTSVDPSCPAQLYLDPASFVIARRWLNFDGTGPLPLRDERVAFRGTLAYSSIDALNGKDQTRLDDLWSWFYVVLDLTYDSLPWMRMQQLPGDIYETIRLFATEKESWHECPFELFATLPELLEIFKHLQSSSPEHEPDYSRLAELIRQMLRRVEENMGNEPKVDWEPGGRYYSVLGPLMVNDQ